MSLELLVLGGLCVIAGGVVIALDYFQYVRRGRKLNLVPYGAAFASIGAMLAAIAAYLK